LASHDKGQTWNVIKTNLDKLNYYTYENPVILNALYFGVPQSRERVVILCKRKDLGELPTLPTISKKNIKKTSLESIIEDNVEDKYKITGKLKVTEKVWNEFLDICNKNNIDIPKYPIWTDWWDGEGENEFYEKYKNWIDKNREFYEQNRVLLEKWLDKSRENKLWLGAVRKMEWQTGSNNLNMSEVLWSSRGSGIRIKNINYSPTLVAMASMIPIYGPKSRYLTPKECSRLQSFPDNYIIHKEDKIAYSQFGNAVNVKMIERSARFLINGEPLFI
jgi:DNA (cytosine-5)-methyltransferase 1